MDTCLSGRKRIVIKLHVNCGRAPARQSKRWSADSDEEAMGLADYADEDFEQCEICRAFDKAPSIPIAGTSIAWRAMDVYFEYSPLIPVRTRNHRGIRGVFCGPRIAIFGRPKYIQTDEGGAWGHELLPDPCFERREKFRPQRAGAHQWLLG